MDLCQYKDIFGKPGEGVHSYRLFNIAVVDVVLTVLLGLLIAYWMQLNWRWASLVVLSMFLLGIFSHWLFCVDTTIHKWLTNWA